MKLVLPLIIAFLVACHPCAAGQPQLQIRTGHGATVESIAFSPDGKRLASAGFDHSTKLWDATTGKEIQDLVGHDAEAFAVSFSPDGQTLASGGNDMTIRLWNVADGRMIRTITTDGSVTSLAFSPDGRTIASGGFGAPFLWNAKSGEKLKRLDKPSSGEKSDRFDEKFIYSVAWSPDGKLVAAGTNDGSIILWDAFTGKAMPQLYSKCGAVKAVAFNPDGRTVAAGTDRGAIVLFELSSGKLLRTISGFDGWIHGLAFSRDGKQLAAGGTGKSMKLYDVSSGRELRSFPVSSGYMGTLAFSPDRRTLAGGDHRAIRFWQSDTGKEIRRSDAEANSGAIVCSPDGKSLTTTQGNRGFRIWALGPGPQSRILPAPDKTGDLHVSPDDKRVATMRSVRKSPYVFLNTVRILDMVSGRELQTITCSNTHSLNWGADSRTLAAIDDTALKLYDSDSGKELHSIPGCESYCWCANKTTVAVGTKIGAIDIWDVQRWQKTKSFVAYPHSTDIIGRRQLEPAAVHLIAWSPDGKTLATECSGQIKVWDLQSGNAVRVINSAMRTESIKASSGQSGIQIVQNLLSSNNMQQHGLSRFYDDLRLIGATIQDPGPGYGFVDVSCLTFSPDGKTLASAEMSDNSIRLWDVPSGKVRRTLKGHTGYVDSISFAPNGKLLVSSSEDRTNRLWDTASGTELARMLSYGDDDWLVATPDGHFDASPGAMKMIYWRDGSHVIENDQLKREFYVSDLLRKAVRGVSD